MWFAPSHWASKFPEESQSQLFPNNVVSELLSIWEPQSSGKEGGREKKIYLEHMNKVGTIVKLSCSSTGDKPVCLCSFPAFWKFIFTLFPSWWSLGQSLLLPLITLWFFFYGICNQSSLKDKLGTEDEETKINLVALVLTKI